MDTTVRRPLYLTALVGIANAAGIALVFFATSGARSDNETYLSPDAALRYALMGLAGVVVIVATWRILRRRVIVIDVLVIAVLLFFIYPNLRSMSGRSPVRRTMSDMRSIAAAAEAFATDYNRYPVARSMDDLARQLSPTYIRVVPHQDSWLTDYRYESWDKGHYAIASAGTDRKFEASSSRSYAHRATNEVNADIVFSNGKFVVYPEGTVDEAPVGLADRGRQTPPPVAGDQPAPPVIEDEDKLFQEATAHYRKDEWTKAIRLFSDFLQTHPDHALATARIGVCYCHLRRYEECITFAQRAIQLDPTDWQSRGNIAVAYEKLGTPERGVPMARESVKLNPREPAVNNILGRALLAAGNPRDAIVPLETVIAVDPGNTDANYNLVLAYHGAKMPERARAQLTKLARINPASAKELEDRIK